MGVILVNASRSSATHYWSAPIELSGCVGLSQPLISFPSSSPQRRSGPGALLWGVGPTCGRGALAEMAELRGDSPGPPQTILKLKSVAAATGTASGQIVVGGAGSGGSLMLAEGSPSKSLHVVDGGDGYPKLMAAYSAPLGDAAITTVQRSGTHALIALRIQRHYQYSLSRPTLIPAGSGPVTAVSVNLDFRSDALITWVSAGLVYAVVVRQGGKVEPTQRLGEVHGNAHLQSLISDDGHAIATWESTETTGPSMSVSTIHLSISDQTAHFGVAHTVARFLDPGAITPTLGCVRLTRLSTENVLMAWCGVSRGKYVVWASPVSLAGGAFDPQIISSTQGDALLSDLTPGPHGDVLALWITAPRVHSGEFDFQHVQIIASRGTPDPRGGMAFAPGENLSLPGPNEPPTAGFDPDTDKPIVAWVRREGAPQLFYALGGAE